MICLPLATLLQAQNQMKTLGVEDGLSQGFVTCMLQDKQGFMWFGTYDGLNRYDGYTVRRFTSKPFDPWSLQSSFITKLYEDDRELLWVGTHHGLYVFDPLTERFFNLSLPEHQLPANPVEKIIIDREGTVFVQFPTEINRPGLYIIQLPPDFKRRLRQMERPLSGITAALVKTPANFRPRSNLLACIGDTMPMVVDGAEGAYGYSQTKRMLQPIDLKALPEATTDDHNLLWGKYQGHHFRRRLPDGRDTVYPPWKWYDFIPLNDGAIGIWLYPHGPLFKKKDRSPIHLDLARDKAQILKDTAFQNAFTMLVAESGDWNNVEMADRRGTIWVGTGGQGVRKINPKPYAFGDLLSGKSISSLHELPNGNLWLRLYSEESLVIDPATGQRMPAPWGNTAWLQEAFADKKGNYWLIECNIPPYHERRLLRYDQRTRQLTRLPVVLPFLNGVPEKILEDKEGNVWVAANQGILLRFRQGLTEMERFSYAESAEKDLQGLRVTAFVEDKNGLIWLGTNRGLSRIGDATRPNPQFTFFKHDAKNPKSLSIDWVTSICPDPKDSDLLWLGTRGGGLNRLDIRNQSFTYISETANGLPDNVVYGVLPGLDGELWCSTNRGLCRFHPAQNTFVTYRETDGLLSTEFNTNSFLRSKDGRLWFGGVNGLNVFRPEEIYANRFPPYVAITAIKVRGAARLPDTEFSLSLPFEENNVLFEFAALDYANPATNRFRHRLKGIDKDWVYDGTQHSANYAALPPGEYILEIEGATADSPWSEQPMVFHLTIRAPWYRSWLAYFVYVLVLGGVIWGIIRYREKLFLLEHTAEINQIESQRLKAFETVKNQFFADVAHELRTPLTVILGLAKRLHRDTPKAEIEENAHNIVEQGNTLLNLTNQILDLAKLESQHFTLSLSNGNISQFVQQQTEALAPLAESKALVLEVKNELPVIWMDFDPIQVQKILQNLLANAIRHSHPAGRIRVETTLEHDDNWLKITVKDEGDGILPADMPHIFERFYQGQQPRDKNGASGLGLTLTRDLVHLMGGEIKVKSTPGKGSTFAIYLPIRNLAPRMIELDKKPHTPKREKTQQNPIDKHKLPLLLILEDNEAVADFLNLCLQDHFNIVLASDGEMGIAKALELIPDLILTDVAMPKKDGFEVTATLKNNIQTSHIPIVMLTAKIEQRDRLEGQRRGANAYLTKPFEEQELLQVLNNLLHLQDQWKQRYAQFGRATEHPVEPEVLTEDLRFEDDFMQKLLLVFEENYTDDTFNLERLCRLMGMSSSQLDRKLKALSNHTPMQLLRSFRLQQARLLLQTTPKPSIKDVCFRTGFKSPAHFSRAFSEEFGVPPSGV